MRPLAPAHDTLYDPGLVDRAPALVAAIADADALIVRNRTQVNACAACGGAEAPRRRASRRRPRQHRRRRLRATRHRSHPRHGRECARRRRIRDRDGDAAAARRVRGSAADVAGGDMAARAAIERAGDRGQNARRRRPRRHRPTDGDARARARHAGRRLRSRASRRRRRVGGGGCDVHCRSTRLLRDADVVTLHVPATASNAASDRCVEACRDEAGRGADQHVARRRRR